MLLRPWMSHWKSTLAVDFLQRDCCSLQSQPESQLCSVVSPRVHPVSSECCFLGSTGTLQAFGACTIDNCD